MLRLTLSRLAGALGAIFGASLFAFVLLRIIPSDPARLALGEFASPQAVANLRRSMGLDDPIWAQYGHFVANFVTGDWGFSYSAGQPVSSLLISRIPATLELGLYSFVIAVGGAVLLAVIATYRRNPAADAAVRSVANLGLGIPRFFLGLVLLVLLSRELGIFPGPEGRIGGDAPDKLTGLYTLDALLTLNFPALWDALWHLALPALTMAMAPMAFLTRLLRANLLDVAHEPYLVVARAKGLDRATAFVRHALPNALLPTITSSGIILGELMAGSVLVEYMFAWPGLGGLAVDAILREDYAPVQAYILLAACLYVVISLTVDVINGMVDPRVRVRGSA